GDQIPLALSVGPADSQPYKVSVRGSRAEFFPTEAWTHVVVTFDHETGQVYIYRNGVRQQTTVDYPASGSATGQITADDTLKVLGYNGPEYGFSHLDGFLDDYRLYSAAASISDVTRLTREHAPDFDPQTVAREDVQLLSVPTQTGRNFPLPAQGAHGSTLTWHSDTPEVISIDGDRAVVHQHPSEATSAHLTVAATYGDSAPVERTYTVTVLPQDAKGAGHLQDVALGDVTLED